MADFLAITDLEFWTRIGIPETERTLEQRILGTIVLELTQKAGETDDVRDTVNYEEIVREIQKLARKERKTLEKLAEDIAATVLKNTHAQRVTVILRKFILPGTKEISLMIIRP